MKRKKRKRKESSLTNFLGLHVTTATQRQIPRWKLSRPANENTVSDTPPPFSKNPPRHTYLPTYLPTHPAAPPPPPATKLMNITLTHPTSIHPNVPNSFKIINPPSPKDPFETRNIH